MRQIYYKLFKLTRNNKYINTLTEIPVINLNKVKSQYIYELHNNTIYYLSNHYHISKFIIPRLF